MAGHWLCGVGVDESDMGSGFRFDIEEADELCNTLRRRGRGGAPFFPAPNHHVDAFYYSAVSPDCNRTGTRFRGIPAIRTGVSLFRNPTPEWGGGGMRSPFPLCGRACENRKAAPKAVCGYCAGRVYVPDPYRFENFLSRNPACR